MYNGLDTIISLLRGILDNIGGGGGPIPIDQIQALIDSSINKLKGGAEVTTTIKQLEQDIQDLTYGLYNDNPDEGTLGDITSIKQAISDILTSLEGYVKEEDIFDKGPEYVDLGLPSGTLWATCNLGATKPEEYGDYYMWGSATPNTNDVCDWEHAPYQTNASASSSLPVNPKWTKYLGSTTSSYKDPSATDEDALKTVLDPEDDAAYVSTDGAMRMPTKEEFDELLNSTTNEWTTENEVYGRKFTSKTDSSKYIFIPAAGCRDGSSVYGQGRYGDVWSSSFLFSNVPNMPCYLVFMSNDCAVSNYGRFFGCTIRPVLNKAQKKLKPELLSSVNDKIDDINKELVPLEKQVEKIEETLYPPENTDTLIMSRNRANIEEIIETRNVSYKSKESIEYDGSVITKNVVVTKPCLVFGSILLKNSEQVKMPPFALNYEINVGSTWHDSGKPSPTGTSGEYEAAIFEVTEDMIVDGSYEFEIGARASAYKTSPIKEIDQLYHCEFTIYYDEPNAIWSELNDINKELSQVKNQVSLNTTAIEAIEQQMGNISTLLDELNS